MSTTYKVEQSKVFKDYRVVEYIDGVWENEYDNNWTLTQAIKVKNDLVSTRHLQYFEL